MTAALRMRWVDLAFLHWNVPLAAVRHRVPDGLQIDTFRDMAWIGITPFRMTGVRPLALPPIPFASDFPELNVRTYVRHGEHAGVYFFSLDAASALAVRAVRAATGLPYYHSRMGCARAGEEVRYRSSRRKRGELAAEFVATYRPTGPVNKAPPGSLEHWLTERYCLFVMRGAKLFRLDIEHEPWPLQPATVEIHRNTMDEANGVMLPAQAPHALYSARLDVVAHLPVAV
jgi:uncharacterized protein YqjF (DUF2071 family)